MVLNKPKTKRKKKKTKRKALCPFIKFFCGRIFHSFFFPQLTDIWYGRLAWQMHTVEFLQWCNIGACSCITAVILHERPLRQWLHRETSGIDPAPRGWAREMVPVDLPWQIRTLAPSGSHEVWALIDLPELSVDWRGAHLQWRHLVWWPGVHGYLKVSTSKELRQRKPSYGFSDLLSDMWLQIFLEIFLWTLADFSWNFVDSSLHLHGFLVHSFEGFITDQKMTLEPWILYQMAWANLFITYTCSSFLLNSVVVLVARQLHIQSHSSWPVSASIDV